MTSREVDDQWKVQSVRLPADCKNWLVEQAAYARSTQTAEIIRSVRERMAAERKAEKAEKAG